MRLLGSSLRRTSTAVLALAVAAVAAPALAADTVLPPRDRVHPADLPTVAQVASIYPNFRGASVEFLRDRQISVLSGDCITYSTVRATAGIWSLMEPAPGRPDYFDGKADPTDFVYKFRTRSRALDVMRRIRNDIVRCQGTFGSQDDYEAVLVPITVPQLGNGAVGFRTRRGGVNSVSEQFDPDYFVETWVRKGRYLINTRVQKDEGWPSTASAIALTRIATRRAG